MIDRSYLPFQAAREYQDPGMQKWMGFFLSEHTSSLHAAKYRVDFSTDLSKPQKLLLLSHSMPINLEDSSLLNIVIKKLLYLAK